MAELGFKRVVVRSVLSEETTVVFALLKKVFGGILLSKVSIALLANPGQ